MNNRNVTFNDNNLETQVTGLQITELPERPPVRDLDLRHIARTDQRTLNSAFYTQRKVNVMGNIKRNSKADLEASLDDLNKILALKEKKLVIPYSDSFREYTATFANMSISQQTGGFAEFDLEFECSDSMAYENVTRTLISETISTATDSWSFALEGSAEWQAPTIQLIFVALTGLTGAVTLSNDDTGQSLTIDRTWSNDDVLVVDSKERTVKINGTDADFSGAIPRFQLPTGNLSYTDEFTTRDVDILITYQKRYI